MNKRQKAILQILSEKGSMSVQPLANQFNVSRMTIYRDINELLKANYIKKVVGGIAKRNYKAIDPGWLAKEQMQKSAKTEIAKFVSKNYIRNNQTIFIESGSTAITLIPFLNRFEKLTVYTNCIAALYAFNTENIPSATIHIIPGVLDYNTQAIIGNEATVFIESLKFDTCFLSATGISLTGKVQDPNLDIIHIKQKVIKRSSIVFSLLDHTKFGKQSQYSSYSLEDIDYIASDQHIPDPFEHLFKKHKITLLNSSS